MPVDGDILEQLLEGFSARVSVCCEFRSASGNVGPVAMDEAVNEV